MIEAIELSKSFGSVQAVSKVSFVVNQGEAVGFLGPNGAGKTTTFRMIAGTIGPSSGQVRLFGKELKTDPVGAKKKLGYMAENAPLYPELSAREYLNYRAELKGLKGRERLVRHAAERVSLSHLLGTQIGHLSKGYRQRVALADAILGAPPVLLLDEPTAGLDPNQVLEVRTLIKELAQDHAILLSTHVLSEVEATCSRAVVIDRGRVVAMGKLDQLKRDQNDRRAILTARCSVEKLTQLLGDRVKGFSIASQSDASSTTCEFTLTSEEALSDAVRLCVHAEVSILEAAPQRAVLDDVFTQLTSPSSHSSTTHTPDDGESQ